MVQTARSFQCDFRLCLMWDELTAFCCETDNHLIQIDQTPSSCAWRSDYYFICRLYKISPFVLVMDLSQSGPRSLFAQPSNVTFSLTTLASALVVSYELLNVAPSSYCSVYEGTCDIHMKSCSACRLQVTPCHSEWYPIYSHIPCYVSLWRIARQLHIIFIPIPTTLEAAWRQNDYQVKWWHRIESLQPCSGLNGTRRSCFALLPSSCQTK